MSGQVAARDDARTIAAVRLFGWALGAVDLAGAIYWWAEGRLAWARHEEFGGIWEMFWAQVFAAATLGTVVLCIASHLARRRLRRSEVIATFALVVGILPLIGLAPFVVLDVVDLFST